MTRYEIKLSEQEELALRNMAATPGFDALLKLLQVESLNAQWDVMGCTDPDKEKRLMLLTDAQATAKVVSALTRKLSAYREILIPKVEQPEEPDPMDFSIFQGRTN